MAIILALPRLYDAVAARFAADGTDVPMVFGWVAVNEQMRKDRRIAWMPGDPSGNLGSLGAPKYPGKLPERPLANLDELCTVEITALDVSARKSERAQYQVTRELFDAWWRAVYLEARGTVRIVSGAWAQGDRAMRMGATLRVVIAVQAVVPDTALNVTSVALEGASIDVHELDVSESISVTPA